MSFDRQGWELVVEAAQRLDGGFEEMPAFSTNHSLEQIRPILYQVVSRLEDNYPYHHPLYAGQMLKPPHPVARLAYALAMLLNPNNHALDGGRASSVMEKEVVAEIAGIFGWQTHLGHLTSSGTIANLEALWIAGQLHPGKTILASAQAHYTHKRMCAVLQLPFETVPADAQARMDVHWLKNRLAQGDVGTVVATLGTTATGSVDPLPEILNLQSQYPFRVHIDSAYGGYYTLANNLAPAGRAAYDTITHADSIVVDPHKHGLQPYGCGCVLFRDPIVGRFYKHDSPYTYFTSDALHLGEISLECSRAGASAVALWATHQLLPLVKGGEFAQGLEKCRQAALTLHNRLQNNSYFVTPFPPELDIVIWAIKAPTISQSSQLAQQLFQFAATQNLHLALVTLPIQFFTPSWQDVTLDQPTITCLRSCLMKPEHLDWLEAIWQILNQWKVTRDG